MKVHSAGLLALILVGATATGFAAEGPELKGYDTSKTFDELTHAEKTAAKKAARQKKLLALRVCADPGNMPMSSVKGEGYQNKIIELLAKKMDTRVVYFWRPYLERGLTRETFANDECDVLLDLPADYQGALTTMPIYRTAYVFATREADNLLFESLDDPRLKQLRVGVFQHSGIRAALSKHGVRDNVRVHVISHDADLRPEKQPWRQVQEVVDGKLDVAAVWGPFAGYVQTVRREPIRLQPANLLDDETPLEFDLAMGMRQTDAVLKFKLDDALDASRDEIAQILKAYGVPLVKCSKCIVAGELPSHGSYFADKQEVARRIFLEPLPEQRTKLSDQATKDQRVTQERLDDWLKDGADLNQELSNAVLASDASRVALLIEKGADINKRNLQGYPPLHMAARQRDSDMIARLMKYGAEVNARDSDGWTPLAHAAFRNHVPSIEVLARAGADLELGPPGFTPLSIALSEGKFFAAKALLDAGASAITTAGHDKLTPLMLVAAQRQVDKRALSVNQGSSPVEIARILIAKGADVNAVSAKGVTPLMVAAAHDNPPLIGVLVQSGADIDTKTPDGKTALDIAKDNQNAAAVQQIEVLRRAEAKRRAAAAAAPEDGAQPGVGQ